MIRILTASAAALLATSVPASAGQTRIYVDDLPKARVSYAGLDLRTVDGRSHMARRIRLAAEDLCKENFVEASITEPARNDCYVAAVASGIRQLDTIAKF